LLEAQIAALQAPLAPSPRIPETFEFRPAVPQTTIESHRRACSYKLVLVPTLRVLREEDIALEAASHDANL